MDSIRSALTSPRDGFVWLPDPTVAPAIIAVALLVALTLHRRRLA